MTSAQITQWLQEPHRDLESDTLQSLLKRYPYFVPLRYMAAARDQEETSPVKLSGYPDLYMGNWLLFHQMLRQSAKIAIIAPTVQQEASEIPAEFPEEAEPSPTLIIPLGGDTTVNEAPSVIDFPVIQPVYTEDYFLHQGVDVDNTIPQELDAAAEEPEEAPLPQDPKSLMVVMSFTEWLMHFKSTTQKEKEEEADRKAVKHMWQKEKLAAALEEEDDEIPENVFEMAVNSISKEDGLASESLAEILAKQGKDDKAIEMYRKLSLRNPQKSAYFAQQIVLIQKKSQ